METKRVFPVRLDESTIRTLAELHLKTGKNPSEQIRIALAAYFKRELKKETK